MGRIRLSLKRTVENTDTRAGRAFDFVIQFLIVVSLIAFAIETVPDLSARTRGVLRGLEVAVVLMFTAEYLLRILVADRRLSFVFSFYGLIDLAAILPFYLTTGLDLRSVRAIRLLRLFRILKMARYNAALIRLRMAFRLAKEELVLFVSASAVIVYVAAVGIYYFENPVQPEAFASVFHAMWWAVSTLTTVGYGDVVPITAGGRLFTTLVLVAGLGVVALPAGVIASALSQVRADERQAEMASVPDSITQNPPMTSSGSAREHPSGQL